MDKRAIIIGSSAYTSLDCVEWDGDIPNIADYDIVIVNGEGVKEKLIDEVKERSQCRYELLQEQNATLQKLKANMELVKRKIVELLDANGTVYALYAPTCEFFVTKKFAGIDLGRSGAITGGTGAITLCKSNDWCPVSLETVSESGTQIFVQDTPYSNFFSLFKEWDFFFDTSKLSTVRIAEYVDSRYKVVPDVGVIATNRSGKPLALQFSYSIHRWRESTATERALARAFGEPLPDHIVDETPEKRSGQLILLPCPSKPQTEKAVEILLSELCHIVAVTKPPEWVERIEMPNESSLKEAIRVKQGQLESVAQEINNLKTQLVELLAFRGLLFESGPGLQEICKSTLERLGAQTKRSPVSDEFIIEVNCEEALVEVKGNTRSISGGDISQLIRDLGNYMSVTGKAIHGILIGNAWRYLPLEKRNTKDKPIFPDNVVEWALNHSIGLLATTELFGAYRSVLAGTKQGIDVLHRIVDGMGIISLSDT